MISGLLREIGGVCPCTGSPKEERHLVGSRGCRRRWRGRGVRRSLQGWDLTITERDAASLKNGNDARRHCPWQGEPGCPNNLRMPAWIPGRRQMTGSHAAMAQVVFEFGEMQVGGKGAAGAKKAHALAWRPWQPHLPCNRQNNKPRKPFRRGLRDGRYKNNKQKGQGAEQAIFSSSKDSVFWPALVFGIVVLRVPLASLVLIKMLTPSATGIMSKNNFRAPSRAHSCKNHICLPL